MTPHAHDNASDLAPDLDNGRRAWPGRGFLLALIALLVIVSSLPYAYAYWSTPDDEVFMGFVGRGTRGAAGYMMLARQAADGHTWMQNRYTAAPLPAGYLSLEWWLFGRMARWTGLSLIAIFQVWRVASIVGFVLAAAVLVRECLRTRARQRLALGILCLGSGLGWLIWLVPALGGPSLHLPPDIRGISIPGYIFAKPHFLRDTAFACLKYGLLLAGLRTGRYRYYAGSGLAAALQTCIRPFHIPETLLIYALLPVLMNLRDGHGPRQWDRRRFLPFGLAAAVLAPAIGLYTVTSRGNPLGLQGWSLAEGFFMPGWGAPVFLFEQALWLGLPFVVTLLCLRWLLRLRHAHATEIFLMLWLLIAWLTCQLYPYYGAGIEAGVHAFFVAPVLFALGRPLNAGMRLGLAQMRPPAMRIALGMLLVIAMLPTSLIVYTKLYTDLHAADAPWNYRLAAETVEALRAAEANAPENAVVLANPIVSTYVPWLTRGRAVTGHDMFTPDFWSTQAEAGRFFAGGMNAQEARAYLDRHRVAWIVAAPGDVLPPGIAAGPQR